jgi:hypothetical protein
MTPEFKLSEEGESDCILRPESVEQKEFVGDSQFSPHNYELRVNLEAKEREDDMD